MSSTGLATPYALTGCNQIDFSNRGVFVEAAIFDPTTSSISVYNLLLVNQGSKVGTNVAMLALAKSTKGSVNRLGDSIFGQVTLTAH